MGMPSEARRRRIDRLQVILDKAAGCIYNSNTSRMKDRGHRTSRTEHATIGPACIAYRARLLSRVISAIYDEALAPLGLKGSQLNVLSALARRGPCAQTELCSLLEMEKSTLSRNIE